MNSLFKWRCQIGTTLTSCLPLRTETLISLMLFLSFLPAVAHCDNWSNFCVPSRLHSHASVSTKNSTIIWSNCAGRNCGLQQHPYLLVCGTTWAFLPVSSPPPGALSLSVFPGQSATNGLERKFHGNVRAASYCPSCVFGCFLYSGVFCLFFCCCVSFMQRHCLQLPELSVILRRVVSTWVRFVRCCGGTVPGNLVHI